MNAQTVIDEKPILQTDALLADAMAATGLSDWGDAEGWGLASFRNSLDTLVAAANRDVSLPKASRLKLKNQITGLLANRLHLAADRKRFPGIAEEKIERPIFVVGFGRTGSTLIHGLLSEDPIALAPRHWEVLRPSPPPASDEASAAKRIALAAEEIEALLAANPAVGVQHPYYITQGPYMTAECGHFFEMTFDSTYFWGYYGADGSYEDLLFDDQTNRAVMDFHKKFLQQLQYGQRAGGRWVLKAPDHTKHLSQLLEVYPDALIIWTHRDIMKVIPSLSSVVGIIRSVYREIDRKAVGRSAADFHRRKIEAGLAVRDRIPKGQLLDLNYDDLLKNPIGKVRDVYAYFDLPWHDENESRMLKYLESNQQNAHGEHKYTLEDLGLTEEGLRSQFRNYVETCKI